MSGSAQNCRAGSPHPAVAPNTAESGALALQDAASSREGIFSIEPAQPQDGASIGELLGAAGLPHEDFAPHLNRFLVARRGQQVIGAVGAEVIGEDALLRSLVVDLGARRAGLGEALVRRIENEAAGWGVQRWWLLTTTAEEFFRKRGFRVTPRNEAPAGIAATAEFRGLCPSMAACLSRERRSA
ncbi:arsenic resistance N-acetyltransferase ArsN2 [Opitutus terrae]|uniref:GCN5-related N-acetyltransferase n=1 Tax=Opitutus terrae (strain DSM 11246 / JCM 15787 / PB90-1) TaxID=452637 RepID=B1ZTU2_OPITP|nr:arsenic resistance N-acetyltransferase ArsN2 [Opitutus terrae]ACB74875.1 GCN5-related N-acetyltransferase [Opitutus terrae PB90-1]